MTTAPTKPPTTAAPAAGGCVLLLGALANPVTSTPLVSTPLEGKK